MINLEYIIKPNK